MSADRHVGLAAAAAAKALHDAADALEGGLGVEGTPKTLWEFRLWLRARAAPFTFPPQAVPSDREELIADYAAFWWAQNTGETETWDELDEDEREAAIEHSEAETVADWIEERQ